MSAIDNKSHREAEASWSAVTNKAVYGVNTFHTPGYPVKSTDLQALNDAIDTWGQFLRNVLLGSNIGYTSKENIEQLGLEDTELYLDVKIQLSQCMSSLGDDVLIRRLESICNDIRKCSYQFINSTLSELNENSRQLVESKNIGSLGHQDPEQAVYVTSSGFGDTSSDMDGTERLTAVRRKLLGEVKRQNRAITDHLERLKTKVDNNLYSEEFEL